MKTIIVKTQKEMDDLPNSFSEYTMIEIRSSEVIVVKKIYDNSTVRAYGNSTVRACNNSKVEAYSNSTVEAYSNSTVEAYDSSKVVACGNSKVVACGNSKVRAYDSSKVRAYDSSKVRAYDSSTVEAYGNSKVDLFLCAYVIVLSVNVVVKRLLDYSTAIFKGCPVKIGERSNTSHAREIPNNIEVSFEEWLRRGFVVADGIHKTLKSQKKINDIQIFECEDFLQKTTSYVVKKGEVFSHGKTIEEAIEDLRYKVSDRDTSRFNHWKSNLDMEVSFEDAIAAYRTVTGACAYGTKEFVKSIKVPDKLTPNIIIELTKNQFGAEKFKEFLK